MENVFNQAQFTNGKYKSCKHHKRYCRIHQPLLFSVSKKCFVLSDVASVSSERMADHEWLGCDKSRAADEAEGTREKKKVFSLTCS